MRDTVGTHDLFVFDPQCTGPPVKLLQSWRDVRVVTTLIGLQRVHGFQRVFVISRTVENLRKSRGPPTTQLYVTTPVPGLFLLSSESHVVPRTFCYLPLDHGRRTRGWGSLVVVRSPSLLSRPSFLDSTETQVVVKSKVVHRVILEHCLTF